MVTVCLRAARWKRSMSRLRGWSPLRTRESSAIANCSLVGISVPMAGRAPLVVRTSRSRGGHPARVPVPPRPSPTRASAPRGLPVRYESDEQEDQRDRRYDFPEGAAVVAVLTAVDRERSRRGLRDRADDDSDREELRAGLQKRAD